MYLKYISRSTPWHTVALIYPYVASLNIVSLPSISYNVIERHGLLLENEFWHQGLIMREGEWRAHGMNRYRFLGDFVRNIYIVYTNFEESDNF